MEYMYCNRHNADNSNNIYTELKQHGINIINLALYFIIPILFARQWQTLIDSAVLYLLCFIYILIFSVGRIGHIDINAGYNFVYSIIGSIDYKIFIINIYLIQKYFGGIRLWKTQKRLIFQKDLKTKKE